jgi:hypothetical protein
MPHWSTPRDRTDAVVEQLLARGARYTIFIAAARGDIDYVRDALARDRSPTSRTIVTIGPFRRRRTAMTSKWSSCCSLTARIRRCPSAERNAVTRSGAQSIGDTVKL